MGVLIKAGVTNVFHYAPLHYLPFIVRARALLSKPSLAAAGFPTRHLRSKSRDLDVERGFGCYSHLTLHPDPNILQAKLGAGFPHIKLVIPVAVVESCPYSLCRFNVAMTRKLRREGKPGHLESETNGRYYPGHQIPIARTAEDQSAMLKAHISTGTMIEVLVQGDLPLTGFTTVISFSADDQRIVDGVLAALRATWISKMERPVAS